MITSLIYSPDSVKEVYEKYKHLDILLSNVPDDLENNEKFIRRILSDLWCAVKKENGLSADLFKGDV